MGLPSRNHTGWACHILLSASGRLRSICSASSWQIARSMGAGHHYIFSCPSALRSPHSRVTGSCSSWIVAQSRIAWASAAASASEAVGCMPCWAAINPAVFVYAEHLFFAGDNAEKMLEYAARREAAVPSVHCALCWAVVFWMSRRYMHCPQILD